MTSSRSIREDWVSFINQLQEKICAALEQADGKARFQTDDWSRPEGGGGKTRVITQGNIFEKGGVNSSVVFGELTPAMRSQLSVEGKSWFACGLSIVLHPANPFVPTVHANYRMFELYNEAGALSDRWFGGGTDLTPYYLIEEDAKHFHQNCKRVCDAFDPGFYATFKAQCDDYFVNKHRNNERRGIGGIFYDYRRPDIKHDENFWMAFNQACGESFLNGYLPIVEKRNRQPYDSLHKHWQEIRRGRYVEFNLVHDRGTLFGLRTNGRIESILMSLPPTARFEYQDQPAPGTEEYKLLQVCLQPRDWV